MNMKLIPVYFIIGGTMVTLITYLGKRGDSIFAALVALFPAITLVSICTIYFRGASGGGGVEKAVDLAKNMLKLLPVWAVYALALWKLLPRLGLIVSLIIGISLYVGGGFVVRLVWP